MFDFCGDTRLSLIVAEKLKSFRGIRKMEEWSQFKMYKVDFRIYM